MESDHASEQRLTLYRSITRRYGLAVLIIAILSTGAFYTLKTALSDSDSTAYIVNISGRQRMLSQHIALDAHRLHRQRFLDQTDFEVTRGLLEVHIDDMNQANHQLTTGALKNKQVVDLSPEIRQMYFGNMDLSNRVNSYLKLATSVLNSSAAAESLRDLREIDRLSEPLLRDLNKVVNQYQKEGEKRLRNIANLELAVWVTTLVALMLEVIFIFRPMAREVVSSKKSEQNLLGHLQEIVELRTLKLEMANKKLKQLANHDPLTGLRNRLTLEGDVETLIKGQVKHRIPFALCMIDLDWFKNINDSLGHQAGDYVLIELAEILLSITRESDKVYRSGGEEFVIVLNRIDLDEAENKMELLRRKVEQHLFLYETNEIRVTISIGLFHSSLTRYQSVHDVIKSADDALFLSKHLGRNRVSLAAHEIDGIDPTQGMIELIFNDPDLTQVVGLKGDISALQAFGSGADQVVDFKLGDLFYEPDQDGLDELVASARAYTDTFLTARLKGVQGEIAIYRVDLLCEKARYIVMLQKARELARSFGNELLVSNFNAMLDNSNDYIYFKDRHHVFTAGSRTLVDLTSVDKREDLVGKTDYEVFPREFADEYYLLEKQVFSGQVEVAQKFQPIQTRDGEKGWVDNRKYPIKDRSGKIIGLFGIARIISDDTYHSLQIHRDNGDVQTDRLNHADGKTTDESIG
jgi:two-component system cell cycle response regulator